MVQAESRTQVMALEENARDFSLTYFAMDDKRQGIVHIIGPEQVCVCVCVEEVRGTRRGGNVPGHRRTGAGVRLGG